MIKIKNIYVLLVIVCFLLSLPAVPAQTVKADSEWPLLSEWIILGDADPQEPGCSNHRNVMQTYYFRDSEYIYLRMCTAGPAGWPSANPQGQARYKWWFDINKDSYIGGTSVYNAEYLMILEDIADNSNDPNLPRDMIGELSLMDDLGNIGFTNRWDSTTPPLYAVGSDPASGSPDPSPYWRRVMGTGTAGAGGPQGSTSNTDIGYRIGNEDGCNYVDMYISWSALDNPSSVCVTWATDIHNNNLDQAPNCDRPQYETCLNITQPGSITIIKETDPDDGTGFGFYTEFFQEGDNLYGNFTLDDNGIRSDSGLTTGTYYVWENSRPSGWSLTYISCSGTASFLFTSGGGDPWHEYFQAGDTGVKIVLPVDGSATIIFTNTKSSTMPAITVRKTVVGSAPDTDWEYTGTLPTFYLDKAGGEQTFYNQEPGNYTITETIKSGYTTTVSRNNGQTGTNSINFDLYEDEEVIVDFVNTRTGTVTVKKTVIGNPPGTDWEFTGTLSTFYLDKAGGEQTFPDLIPGKLYTISETTKNGYIPSVTCNTGETDTSSVTFRLDPGEDVIATFINKKSATPAETPKPPDEEEAVGIKVYPANKLSILLPWLGLALCILVGVAMLAIKKRSLH